MYLDWLDTLSKKPPVWFSFINCRNFTLQKKKTTYSFNPMIRFVPVEDFIWRYFIGWCHKIWQRHSKLIKKNPWNFKCKTFIKFRTTEVLYHTRPWSAEILKFSTIYEIVSEVFDLVEYELTEVVVNFFRTSQLFRQNIPDEQHKLLVSDWESCQCVIEHEHITCPRITQRFISFHLV